MTKKTPVYGIFIIIALVVALMVAGIVGTHLAPVKKVDGVSTHVKTFHLGDQIYVEGANNYYFHGFQYLDGNWLLICRAGQMWSESNMEVEIYQQSKFFIQSREFTVVNYSMDGGWITLSWME